jgi:hypothetical protein
MSDYYLGWPMTDHEKRKSQKVSSNSLKDSEIVSVRGSNRRSFLRTLGLALTGATATVVGASRVTARDFPKGTSDGDVTTNADLKYADSDQHNSKAVNSDRNRLRDVRRSSNSD